MTAAQHIGLQEIAAAKHREMIRAHGGAVVGDADEDRRLLKAAGEKTPRRQKGRTVPKQAGEAEVEEESTPRLPARFELDVNEPDHVMVIKRADGTAFEIRPKQTFGSSRMIGWYGNRIEALEGEATACDDPQEAERIIAEIYTCEQNMLRLSIPDLPEGLIMELSPITMTSIRVFLNEIGNEIVQETVRVVGKLRGQP